MKKLFLLVVVFIIPGHLNAQGPGSRNASFRIADNAGSNGWSPDGKLFATYTRAENKTRLWNLNDNRVMWEVSLNPGRERSEQLSSQTFIWSSNQEFLLVLNAANEVHLLKASNGQLLWKNATNRDNLELIRFSPDNEQLVLVFSDKKVRTLIEFWNLKNGKLQKSFRTHIEFFDSFAFSQDGKLLKFGNFEGKAIFIDSTNGKVVKEFSLRPCGTIANTFSNKTEFSPSLTYLVGRCRDKTVITEVATGRVHKVLDMRADFEKTIGFSGDEKVLVLENLGYKVLNFSDGSEKDVEDPDLWFHVDLNYDGSLLMNNTDYRDRGYAILETQTGKVIRNLEDHPGDIKSLAFSPDGLRFASASSDGIVRVWETESRRLVWGKLANDRGTNVVAFSPDGKLLLSAGDNENDVNPIKVWDADKGDLLKEVLVENDGIDGVSTIVFSSDGQQLLTSSSSVSFKLWDTRSWTVVRTFQTYEEHRRGNVGWCCGSPAVTLLFEKSGGQIISSHEDGTIKFWDVGRPEPVRILQTGDSSIRIRVSPDGRQILAVGANGKLIDANDGRTVQEYKTGVPGKELDYVTDATFLDDGKRFVTTSWFDDVMVWETQTGKLLNRLNVGYSTDDVIQISPNGKYLLAGGENKNIMLFDVSTLDLAWSLFPIDKELRRYQEKKEEDRIAALKRREQFAARADVENRVRIKKISARFSHYGYAESFWDQRIAESGRPNKSKVRLPKETATVAWFTLTNDSDLPISIDTNSMILSDPKCKGLCSGAEISLRYEMELKNGATAVNGIDMYSSTLLPPKRTVYFSILLDHFSNSKAIYLGFTFQKDNPDDERSNDYGTEQQLYVRESDLPR